jgi:hypothetical protein
MGKNTYQGRGENNYEEVKEECKERKKQRN